MHISIQCQIFFVEDGMRNGTALGPDSDMCAKKRDYGLNVAE